MIEYTEEDVAIIMRTSKAFGESMDMMIGDRRDWHIMRAAMGGARDYVEGWTAALIAQDRRAAR